MEDYSKIEDIDPDSPQPEIIKRAVEIIKNGGVVVFPTWCFYGLGCDAFNEEALKKVFHIKRRPSDKPLLVLVSDSYDLTRIVEEVPQAAKKIIEKFWPGRITLIFKAKKHIPDILTSGTGKIGIRVPEKKVARDLVDLLGTPLTGTSANISNEPGCYDIKKLPQSIIDESDLVLDSGILKGGKGSTIIDVTENPPVVIREGEINSELIFKAINLSNL